jgi:YVTN family beta-propeller protein
MARILVLATAAAFALILGTAPASAQKAYITNIGSDTVSVINTATNQVVDTITVGTHPYGVAVTPNGSFVYVANFSLGTVSVISTATNQVVDTVTVGGNPLAVAVTPNGNLVYVTNIASNAVTVIATANQTVVKANTVVETIPVGNDPAGVAVTPNGSFVYVVNDGSNTVTPDGSAVYVANFDSSTVSVIATASNTVSVTIPVGSHPKAYGNFIGPPTLTVAEAGTGGGQVTSSPTNIDCGGGNSACAAMFPDGTHVTRRQRLCLRRMERRLQRDQRLCHHPDQRRHGHRELQEGADDQDAVGSAHRRRLGHGHQHPVGDQLPWRVQRQL